MDTYADFLRRKSIVAPTCGADVPEHRLHPALYEWQRRLVRWSLRKGRAALFADCGLGKTIMQLAWAQHAADRVLILAPLAVAQQTVREGEHFGVPVTYARREEDAPRRGITITNYEMMAHFDPLRFDAVILDESSILRDFEGKTRTALIEAFRETPQRLCCTATPARNDIEELSNHAEFLGVMTRQEMLAHFFVHDECFMPDTPVDTPDGVRCIAAIRPGDKVLNAYGIDTVVETAKREVSALIEVWFDGASVLCSPNHPWFTRRGWVSARSLIKGDELVTQREALRMVRGDVHGPDTEGAEQGPVLRQILLGEMADEPAEFRREFGHSREAPETFSGDESLFCLGQRPSGNAPRAGTSFKADAPARRCRESQRHHESAGCSAPATDKRHMARWTEGRQRSRLYAGTGVVTEVARPGLGRRSDDLMGLSGSGISQLLSCGSSASQSATRCGGRWEDTSAAPYPSERPQERGVPRFSRVDRVEVHEQRSPAFARASGGSDTITLYDLTVAHHPSFSVRGALVHNSGWRLKGHARQAFFRWLASWGMSVKKPSDLGYSDERYDLPPLSIKPHFVESDYTPPDRLIDVGLKGIGDRAAVRRGTLDLRVHAARELIRAEPDEPWLCWVGLNDEGRQLHRLLPHATIIEGGQSPDEKAEALLAFSEGRTRILITKASISGLGLNWQHCARMAFVGLGDSYQDYYQCIRRCWRYGQTRPVTAHIVLTDREEPIYANVLRKEREAEALARELIANVAAFERAELAPVQAKQNYAAHVPMEIPTWL